MGDDAEDRTEKARHLAAGSAALMSQHAAAAVVSGESSRWRSSNSRGTDQRRTPLSTTHSLPLL